MPGRKHAQSVTVGEIPVQAGRTSRRFAVRVIVATGIFLGGYFAGFARASGEWRAMAGVDVSYYVRAISQSQLFADVKNLAMGVPSPDSIKLRYPLTPLQQRLVRRQANPELSWLPLNLDGTILRYYSDVYRLFLPAEEMATHGLTPAQLMKKLGCDVSRADDPNTVVFTVELIRLTQESKDEIREKAALYRTSSQRVDELFRFHKRVIAFTNDDIRKGVDRIEDEEKRKVLTNIVSNARGIPPLSGVPSGYAAYTEWKIKDYDITNSPVLVFALPRRTWTESELADLDDVAGTTIGQ
jgi:hypothetical protein